MMQALRKPVYTVQEYLDMERAAETKSEYLAGEIYAMTGASLEHNTVMANTLISLGIQLKGSRCSVLGSDMRVRIEAADVFTYPDISVVCGKAELTDDHLDSLTNPRVIIEILSKSTESYDRGLKFRIYRKLESLTDYLLIAQDMASVDHYSLNEAGQWVLQDYTGLNAVGRIESIGCDLPLADIYDKVEFLPESELRPRLRVIKEEAAAYEIDPAGWLEREMAL